MARFLSLVLCLSMWLPSIAAAEAGSKAPATEDEWVKALRGSGSYREGLDAVRELVERAYDLGGIAGASHWEDVHEYYSGVARAKGCQRGKPFADGPVKACHQVTGSEPGVVGPDYKDGMAKTVSLAEETLYPSLVKRVLVVLYDYGYVQGMKYGLRFHNDDIRLAQTYYRSCMARANDAKGEAPCAESSKKWADKLLARMRQQIEAHGLPARSGPK
ncbi:MAG: hypothetical protein WBM48_00425 [Polyangiales bacterium]